MASVDDSIRFALSAQSCLTPAGDPKNRSYPCPHCSKVFTLWNSRYYHIKAIHERVCLACVCGKAYNRRPSLLRHQKLCPLYLSQVERVLPYQGPSVVGSHNLASGGVGARTTPHGVSSNVEARITSQSAVQAIIIPHNASSGADSRITPHGVSSNLEPRTTSQSAVQAIVIPHNASGGVGARTTPHGVSSDIEPRITPQSTSSVAETRLIPESASCAVDARISPHHVSSRVEAKVVSPHDASVDIVTKMEPHQVEPLSLTLDSKAAKSSPQHDSVSAVMEDLHELAPSTVETKVIPHVESDVENQDEDWHVV